MRFGGTMKRAFWIALGTAALSVVAFAQQVEIDNALLAAPGNLKNNASVVHWKDDYTYETLKQGTRDIVGYDKSGKPGHPPFSVACTNKGNLPREAQDLKLEAIADKAASKAAFDNAEKDGTRVKPVFGSVWYHFEGPDREHAHTHMTIAVPGATQQTLGLPENGKSGGVWIMDKGTSTAHLMTPGE